MNTHKDGDTYLAVGEVVGAGEGGDGARASRSVDHL
jgi:hypothetical protein